MLASLVCCSDVGCGRLGGQAAYSQGIVFKAVISEPYEGNITSLFGCHGVAGLKLARSSHKPR